jgi:hypothetical protein
MTDQTNAARHRRRHRGLRWLLATALVAWTGSWPVIYLEVTRWHHMSSPWRFRPPAVPAGAPAPHPGLPVITAVALACAAPLVSVLAATLLLVTPAARSRRDKPT